MERTEIRLIHWNCTDSVAIHTSISTKPNPTFPYSGFSSEWGGEARGFCLTPTGHFLPLCNSFAAPILVPNTTWWSNWLSFTGYWTERQNFKKLETSNLSLSRHNPPSTPCPWDLLANCIPRLFSGQVYSSHAQPEKTNLSSLVWRIECHPYTSSDIDLTVFTFF